MGQGQSGERGKKVRPGSTAMCFAFSLCRLPSPSMHLPYLTFNSSKRGFTAVLVTSFRVAFHWWNSSKLLLPPNPTLLLSLSVAASHFMLFLKVFSDWKHCTRNYGGEQKKNHQPNTNFVRTLFSQNAARHLLKITIPHILHFIYKIICSPDCCPARALKMCFENTSVPWKTQENLKRKQGNNPNNFLLHLLIKPSIYSDQNLFASNWKGIQAQSFSTLCSHSCLQVLSLLIYSQPPAAVHGQQLTASPLLTGRILSWNTVYSHRHYHNLI